MHGESTNRSKNKAEKLFGEIMAENLQNLNKILIYTFKKLDEF